VCRGTPLRSVKRVVSEINVAEPTSFANRVHYSWITGQVKAKMLDTPNRQIDIVIKVVTENSVVYLMGLVKQSEGDLAAETARHRRGHHAACSRLFEYLD